MQDRLLWLAAMRHTSLSGMPCPVARSLDVVGEWWTLLIVRDAYLGARRFEDFRASGIADNILSARLKRLVDEGILERRRYDERRERFEYLLTEKGRALMPVLAALRRWGKEWTEGPDGSRLTHDACGHELTVRVHCDECGRPVSAEEVRATRAAAPA
jgi:DNA-binding HxlR family transcriptional regulator